MADGGRNHRMRMRSYRDLEVWQHGMLLAREIYRATENFPKSELFGLTAQMRRAAVSVPSNIAEGQGRSSDRAFRVFLAQACGSLFELETQLELAKDFGFVTRESHDRMRQEWGTVGRLLHGLLRSLQEGISAHNP